MADRPEPLTEAEAATAERERAERLETALSGLVAAWDRPRYKSGVDTRFARALDAARAALTGEPSVGGRGDRAFPSEEAPR